MSPSGRPPRRAGGILVAVAAFVFGLVLAWRLWPAAPGSATAVTVEFQSSPAGAPVEIAAPVQITVTLDLRTTGGSGPRVAPYVDLQLRDTAGRPAPYGSTTPAPLPMHVTGMATGWVTEASAPTQPGQYHAHLIVRTPGQPDREIDLPSPVLDVVPAVPYTGGFVYSRNGQLWRADSTGAHTHRLTFFNDDGRAGEPAWAPDGRRLAFTRTLAAAASEIPNTEIWTMDPTGAAPAVLVPHRPGEDLAGAAFAPDGTLRFTSDRTVDPATGATPTIDQMQNAVESWNLEKADAAGGGRRPLLADALMADVSRDGRTMVYLGASASRSEIQQPVTHTLNIARSDGTAPRLLVPGGIYDDIYAPRLSPDGTQVAFVAVNRVGVPDGLNLWQQLGLAARPVAANGVPWDIYLVPAAGGTIKRLTTLNADQPFPAWSRDGQRLAVLTERGLYIVDLAHPAAALHAIGPGSSHGQLAWYEP